MACFDTRCVLLFLLPTGLTSCVLGDPFIERLPLYVGEAAGSDAVIAVTIADSEIVAYVCGGATSYTTQSKWYRGQLPASDSTLSPADSTVSLSTVSLVAKDGTTMLLSFDADGVPAKGTVGDASAELSKLRSANPDDVRGLYSAVDQGCRTGVIVFGDPQSPRIQGTWCSTVRGPDIEGGTLSIFAQVTPILPVTLDASGGLRVRVEPPGVSRDLVTLPFHPYDTQ